jgi:hypothetical protein
MRHIINNTLNSLSKEMKEQQKKRMRTLRKRIFLALLLTGATAVMVPQHALAAGTLAGTSINNQATMNFQIGGIAQTPVNSNTSTFKVDNKVIVTVAATGNAIVVPGSTNQVLAFTVTNNGNAAQRYALAVTAQSGIAMNNIRIYRDTNGDGAYQAGTDTLYVDASTFGDIAADGVLKVLVLADTPSAATNSQTAVYDLVATTVDAGTTTVTTQTAGADDPTKVDVVFADAAGSDSGDAARDGKHSASATYTVSAAVLSFTKSSAVYSDPYSGTTNPKAIPGAIVTYTMTIVNSGGAATASAVTISDSLDAEITAGHLAFKTQFNDGTAGASCNTAGYGIAIDPGDGSGQACKTNAGGDDNANWNVTTANAVTVSGLSIAAGVAVTIKFQVTIQ